MKFFLSVSPATFALMARCPFVVDVRHHTQARVVDLLDDAVGESIRE